MSLVLCWTIASLVTFTACPAIPVKNPIKIRVNSFGMGATVTPMFLGMLGDRPLPPGTMQSDDVAAVLVDLLAEGPDGRTGDDVQVWAGHGTVLPPVGLEGRLAATDVSGER